MLKGRSKKRKLSPVPNIPLSVDQRGDFGALTGLPHLDEGGQRWILDQMCLASIACSVYSGSVAHVLDRASADRQRLRQGRCWYPPESWRIEKPWRRESIRSVPSLDHDLNLLLVVSEAWRPGRRILRMNAVTGGVDVDIRWIHSGGGVSRLISGAFDHFTLFFPCHFDVEVTHDRLFTAIAT